MYSCLSVYLDFYLPFSVLIIGNKILISKHVFVSYSWVMLRIKCLISLSLVMLKLFLSVYSPCFTYTVAWTVLEEASMAAMIAFSQPFGTLQISTLCVHWYFSLHWYSLSLTNQLRWSNWKYFGMNIEYKRRSLSRALGFKLQN